MLIVYLLLRLGFGEILTLTNTCAVRYMKESFFLGGGGGGGGLEWILSTKRCAKHANCKMDRVSINSFTDR